MLAIFFFLNPFTMIIGGALIASPIIIHLINRMRFKRVRWAAMEFLLKAQKRSRKRMIIEQLILLLLRILLVLLVALLLSRFVEKKPEAKKEEVNLQKEPPRTTLHVVILDDSASMADRWREEEGVDRGQEVSAYLRARKAVNEYIVDAVKDDNLNPHNFMLIRTSKPDKERDFALLTEQSKTDIEAYLKNDYAVQPFHYDFQPALKQAKAIFEEAKTMNLVLHIVSDFRAGDWNDATKDSLGAYFEHFKRATVQVKLHDVTSPIRKDEKLTANDNLAIVDFRPESRVVIKDFPVEFTVTVANYSASDKQNVLIRVKVNNEEKRDGTVNIPLIRANDTVTARVAFSLDRTAPKAGVELKGETQKYDGFNLVSAQIENQFTGLAIDDVRYTVVEVRDKISILLVDNNTNDRTLKDGEYQLTKNAESFYLWKLFNESYKGFDVKTRTAAEMEKMNLAPFSAIVLCDIPLALTPAGLAPAWVQKLESFLNAGGGVGFFMGPSIRDPKFYNELLYKEGKGMFPVPLKEIANKNLTVEQLTQYSADQRSFLNMKLLVRKEMRRHPAMEKLYSDSRTQNFIDAAYEKLFYFVVFARYYIVDRPKWNPGDDIQTLLYLPNTRSIADFERPTKDLLRKLREATDESTRRAQLQQKLDETKDDAQRQVIQGRLDNLKNDMEKFTKYAKTVKEYSDIISNTVGKYDNPLHKLVIWMDVLLEDPGENKDGKSLVPSMIEFWQAPELAELKQEFQQHLYVIKYGDPFYIAKQYKKGRVLAFMGAAGTSGPEGGFWNPLNAQGREYFPPLMKDSLQRYLCSTGGDFFLPLGKSFEFELDAAAYEPAVKIWHAANNDKPAREEDRVKFEDRGLKEIVPGETLMSYTFADGMQPGMYLFEFTPRGADGSAKKDVRPDIRALTYNFDTKIESNLARARTDDLIAIARVDKIETMDEASQPKKISKETEKIYPPEESDLGWSKSPWLYLFLLLALILEQAWAVRLSFHARNSAGPNIPQALHRGQMAV